MAVVFMEQTETGNLAWMLSQNGSANAATTAGTWSTYSYRNHAGGTSDSAVFANSVSEFYGQARIFVTSISTIPLLSFDSPNNTTNCYIGLAPGGQIRVVRGSTVLGLGTKVFALNTWYFVQFYIKIHDTTGAATVKVDGVTEFALSNVDTRNDGASGGDVCDRIQFDYNASDLFLDDVIVYDTAGSTNITYPDNLGIEALIPNAAGDVTGLTPLGGANYTNVDERPPDSATSYVSSGTVDLYDLYNIPATQWNSVACVALDLNGVKTDAGAKSIAHMVKADTDANSIADTEYQGADIPLSTTYTTIVKYYDQQPDLTNWTVNKVNALQIGAKVRP